MRSTLMGLVTALALCGVAGGAIAQGSPASGPVWVDINGNVVGPAVGADGILFDIPSLGAVVLPVRDAVLPMNVGDPVRWRIGRQWYMVRMPVVMRFESSDCSGQGYADSGSPDPGNSFLVRDIFDSVKRWIIVSSYAEVSPKPHFNSQLVQGEPGWAPPLNGYGIVCQSVDVYQGGTVVQVLRLVEVPTLPMTLR